MKVKPRLKSLNEAAPSGQLSGGRLHAYPQTAPILKVGCSPCLVVCICAERFHEMALNESALLELSEALRSADDGSLMRTLLHTILQALIDSEAQNHIVPAPHHRTQACRTQRHGSREKMIATTSGDLTVKIRKTRTGSFFRRCHRSRNSLGLRVADHVVPTPADHVIPHGDDVRGVPGVASNRSRLALTDEVSEGAQVARRTFQMIDLIEIYVHWDAGRSQAQIADSLESTVRRCVSTWRGSRRRGWCRVGRRRCRRRTGAAGRPVVPGRGRQGSAAGDLAGDRFAPGLHHRPAGGSSHGLDDPPAAGA